MGGQVSRDDFEWVYTQHPHVDRRKIIIGKQSHTAQVVSKLSVPHTIRPRAKGTIYVPDSGDVNDVLQHCSLRDFKSLIFLQDHG